MLRSSIRRIGACVDAYALGYTIGGRIMDAFIMAHALALLATPFALNPLTVAAPVLSLALLR